MNKMNVILASKSPRRRQLLSYLFDDFEVVSPDVNEAINPGTSPEDAVSEIACRKARAVVEGISDCFTVGAEYSRPLIIAADTLVVLDGEFLGKPKDKDDARRMLGNLSGRIHQVYTGVCVMSAESAKSISFCEQTSVEFYPLSGAEINDYIATGEPMDKAGAYGIQEKGSLLVKRIDGDFYNVMGLPLGRLMRMIGLVRS